MVATKIAECIDEIDSSESTFNSIVWAKNNLVIPYVNLGVAQHPLNETNKLKFINFAYIVCLNVSYLAGWSELKREDVMILGGIRQEPIYYFGGTNLEDEDSIFNDFKICCENIYLQTINNSELSINKWPTNTKEALDFWSGKFMPDDIRELRGSVS